MSFCWVITKNPGRLKHTLTPIGPKDRSSLSCSALAVRGFPHSEQNRLVASNLFPQLGQYVSFASFKWVSCSSYLNNLRDIKKV